MLLCALVCIGAAHPRDAASHPLADLEVGDPLERELRMLDLIPPGQRGSSILLSHLGTRPLLRDVWNADSAYAGPGPLARVSWVRLARGLGRDASVVISDSLPASTPYAVSVTGTDGARFDFSPGLEGQADADRDTTRWADGSGLQLRGALGLDHWIGQLHLFVGEEAGGHLYTDPIVTNSDVIVQTDQALIGYIAPRDRFGFRFGRGRWHWGPGNEASLVLSQTSAPLTALELHLGLADGRLALSALSGALQPSSGQQLAAHRIEWQPVDAVRLGASEAVRYHATGWSPLYVIGLIPYSLVQRLQNKDEPDSTNTLHNNVMISVDASWRVALGTRLYGEFLVDDLHSRTNDNPDKLAYQVGWDGMGSLFGTRLSWNGEYTRLSRYIYTSNVGLEFSAQGRPLGFPTGPDASRLLLDVRWDPNPDWQLIATALRQEKGENDLGEPFVQGSPRQPAWEFSGVVEHTRAAELGVRWWPAGGVDAAISAGYEWRENAGHVAGADRESAIGSFALRLHR